MTDPKPFSGRLRLRACGLLVEKERLLAVKLRSPVIGQMIWMPPGGEVQFGEGLEDALRREFIEETKTRVEVRGLLHVEELIEEKFHAVECYFEVSRAAGEPEPQLGSDPELGDDEQLLQKLDWLPVAELSHYNFVPQELVPKLKNWQNRTVFNFFES